MTNACFFPKLAHSLGNFSPLFRYAERITKHLCLQRVAAAASELRGYDHVTIDFE